MVCVSVKDYASATFISRKDSDGVVLSQEPPAVSSVSSRVVAPVEGWCSQDLLTVSARSASSGLTADST